VVYEDIYDAKTAVEHLSGFNVANRYLIVLYYNHNKHSKKVCPVCSNSLSEVLWHHHSFPFFTRLSSVPLLSLLVCKQGSHESRVCGHAVAQRVLCCVQLSTKDKEEELLKMQEKYGVDAEQHPQKPKNKSAA